MKAITKWLAGAATLAALASAAPAAAQYYDYRYNRDRDVVEQIVDGVARVAGAVTGVTQGRYYDPRYGNRYGYGNAYGYGSPYGYSNGYGYAAGADRNAADACAYEAQRRYVRRYGGVGVNIRSVQPYRYDRARVYGTVDLGGGYGNYDRYRSYDRYGRTSQVAFDCTVRADGRVTGFHTNRYGY